jgi:hypothetical protein
MEHNRLVELAIKGLEAERARIDQELGALRSLGRGSQTSASTSKAIDAMPSMHCWIEPLNAYSICTHTPPFGGMRRALR